jgi:hypothetical protein
MKAEPFGPPAWSETLAVLRMEGRSSVNGSTFRLVLKLGVIKPSPVRPAARTIRVAKSNLDRTIGPPYKSILTLLY